MLHILWIFIINILLAIDSVYCLRILMVEKSKTVSTKSMDQISNAFSLLEMDAEDDRIETTSSSNDTEKANGICDSSINFVFAHPKKVFQVNSSYNRLMFFYWNWNLRNIESCSYLYLHFFCDVADSKEEADGHKNVLEGNYRLPLVWIDLEMTGINCSLLKNKLHGVLFSYYLLPFNCKESHIILIRLQTVNIQAFLWLID